jgi:hypothetical protein
MKKRLLTLAMLGLVLHGFSQNNLKGSKGNEVKQVENALDAAGGSTTYCASKGLSTANEYIQLVNFGGTDNVSGNNNGYLDATWDAADITAGQATTIQIKAGYTGAVRPEVWTMYIDYNQDGDFNDAGEKVGSMKTNTALLVNSKAFKIPATAKTGETRMRIQMHYNTLITDPCATFNYGEVEDYSVNISAAGANASNELLSNVSVSPNPVASSAVRLNYTLAKTGNITFKLSDANGFASSYKAGIQNKGANSYVINNLSSLHNGYYYVSVEQDGKVIGKITVLVAH